MQLLTLVIIAISHGESSAGFITVFSDDFDGGQFVAPGVSATFANFTNIESVQGYAGIGNGSNQFSGNFLRNTSGNVGPAQPTTLLLTGLPTHTSVDIRFLAAMIDSWDGASGTLGGGSGGVFSPDFFNVTVNGSTVFHAGFDNFVLNDDYDPPPNALLSFGVELGFRPAGGKDSAYDLGVDPAFSNIPHSANSLSIEWFASGSGWQGGADESFGIENVQIILNGAEVNPVPGPSSLLLSTIGALLATSLFRRKRSRRRTKQLDQRGIDR